MSDVIAVADGRSRKEVHQDFFSELYVRGLLEFGSVFERTIVHLLLDIEVPEIGTRAEFRRVELLELGAMDYVRGELLKVGRYLAGTPSGYRVLLPSENQVQVEHYIQSASRKLSRAYMLSKNTPTEFRQHDQTQARIELMKSGRSRFTGDGASLS